MPRAKDIPTVAASYQLLATLKTSYPASVTIDANDFVSKTQNVRKPGNNHSNNGQGNTTSAPEKRTMMTSNPVSQSQCPTHMPTNGFRKRGTLARFVAQNETLKQMTSIQKLMPNCLLSPLLTANPAIANNGNDTA